MNGRAVPWVVVAATLLAGASVAAAQQMNRPRTVDNISRPSQSGPSTVIGGAFTRGNAAPMQPTQRRVATLGEQQNFFRGNINTRPSAALLPMAQVGLRGPIGSLGRSSYGSGLLGRPGLIAGFHAPHDYIGDGYAGMRSRPIPAIDAHIYTPRPPTTRFQDLFDLRPVDPALDETDAYDTLTERFEAQTQRTIQRSALAGLDLFRAATVEPLEIDARTGLGRYPNCTDCREKLMRAVQQLDTVQTLETDAYLPAILLVHAYLEQEKPMQAAGQLLRAWERKPDLLADPRDIDPYFGDSDEQRTRSQFLETQMRRYVRIGELNPGSPVAHLLEAYCAWRLGDEPRARAAAKRAEETAHLAPDRMEMVLGLAGAMAELE